MEEEDLNNGPVNKYKVSVVYLRQKGHDYAPSVNDPWSEPLMENIAEKGS